MKQPKNTVHTGFVIRRVHHGKKISASKRTALLASSSHMRAISRQLWLLYLYSPRARARLLYEVFSKKYPRKNICDIYCTSYASRKRCEHIANSPWTRAGTSMATTLLFLVVFQLAYPSDRALPLARLEGHGFVGFNTQRQIADKISGLNSKDVIIQTQVATAVSTYAGLGLNVDVDTTFNELRSYSVKERIIPFSILLSGNKTVQIDRSIDDAKLTEFIKKIGAESAKLPKDAAIAKDGTKLVVVPAEDGYLSSVEILKQQLLAAKPGEESIVLSPQLVPPRISTQAAKEKALAMQKRIDSPLTIKAAEQTLVADSAVLVAWTDIVPRPDKGTFELGFNRERVENFLKPLPALVDQPAKSEVVTLLNGLVAGSRQGVNGRVLNFGELVNTVADSTNPGTATVWAKVDAVLPVQSYDRRYTRDNQGIQNLIDYWSQTHAGRHGVDFRSLNGRIAAASNSHLQFTAAGSSKIYIAHLIAGRLDAGSLHDYTMTSAGSTVAACMDKMLRLSDNACANALGAIVGWGSSTDMLHVQGFADTSLFQGSGSTSANDMSLWFSLLASGSLTSATQESSLIDLLSRQTVRSGIPTGSPGILVADKAGSLRGNTYDTALVYHPRGAYILSVISDGGSLAAMSELAAQINHVLGE